VAEKSKPDPLADPVTTSYTYDVGNRLSGTSTSDGTSTQTRTFTYDNRGLLTSEASPEKTNAVTYTYDARGHATRIVDGPFDLTYSYDAAERLTSVKETGGGQRTLKSFSFATANSPANCTSGSCDALNGKLSQAVRNHYDDVVTGGVSVTESYQYAGLGGRVSSRDTVVTSTSAFLGASFTTTQHYDGSLGVLDTIGYPRCTAPSPCTATGGSRNAYYGYSNGWMTFVGSDGPAYASMTYQPSGLVDTITHQNGVIEQWIGDPNGMARPCAIFATGGGTTLQNSTSGTCGKVISSGSGISWTTGQYSYDGAGNITQMGTKKFLYDAVNRLTAESDGYSNTSASYSLLNTYSYDAFGNMTRQTNGQSYLCNADLCDGYAKYNTTIINIDPQTNRLRSPDAYDTAGNLTSHATKRTTQSYAWDPVGTMRNLSDTTGRNVHYLYTADDERLAVITPAGSGNQTTWSLRGFGNQLLRRFSDDSSSGTRSWSWSEDEVWRGPSLVANESPSDTKHYVLDHLGSPRLVTGANAAWLGSNDFSAFGMGGTQGSGALQFTRHERDWGADVEQTLDYMHARFCHSTLGRFLSPDPQGFWDLQFGNSDDERRFRQYLSRPQVLNRYAYVENNPLKYTDPDGKEATLAVAGAWLFGSSSTTTAGTAVGATAATGGAVIGVAATAVFAVGWSVGSLINEIPGVSSTVSKGLTVLLDNTVYLAENNRQTQAVISGQLTAALIHLDKIGSAGGPGRDPDFNHHKGEIKAFLDRALKLAKRLPKKSYELILQQVRDIGSQVGLEY
jgi:RHS repeat-associated protein